MSVKIILLHVGLIIFEIKPLNGNIEKKVKPIALILCTFFFYSSAFYSAPVISDTKKEILVKAAFIIKLTHFIKWPKPTATHLSNPTFTICLNHSQKLNDTLSKWAESNLIKNKPVTIKNHIYDANQFSDCNIIYISDNEKLSFILNQAKNNHTLTISNTLGNAKHGVMINFINSEGKLRFEINLNAAKDSGFKINPRLLKLATIVSSDEVKQ